VTLIVYYYPAMEKEGVSLTIEELAERVDVPVRTVRFYITQGLLPGPGARGRAASYGEEQLLRLRLVRRLVARRVPLEEIRDKLRDLHLEDVKALLAEEELGASREAREERKLRAGREVETRDKPSPKDYVAALLKRAGYRELRESPAPPPPAMAPAPTPELWSEGESSGQPSAARSPEPWRRWELLPGVELHVRADSYARYRDLIERVLRMAEDTRTRWVKR
jgi:DNA-binding transcriptional MerR regulator